MNQKAITTATIVAGIMACGAAATNVHAQTSDPALNALVKKGILTEKEAKDALAAAEADFKKKPGPTIEASWKDGGADLGKRRRRLRHTPDRGARRPGDG